MNNGPPRGKARPGRATSSVPMAVPSTVTADGRCRRTPSYAGGSAPPAPRSRSGSGRGKSFNDMAASLRNWRTDFVQVVTIAATLNLR